MNLFSKYVYIYETEIKHYGKFIDFLQISEKAAYMFKHKIQPKVKYASKTEIAAQTDFTKQTLFFTKDKVQILDFCRHLRNSFVHALLEKRGPMIFIQDKNRTVETCKGYLDYKILKEFLIQLVNDFESNL